MSRYPLALVPPPAEPPPEHQPPSSRAGRLAWFLVESTLIVVGSALFALAIGFGALCDWCNAAGKAAYDLTGGG